MLTRSSCMTSMKKHVNLHYTKKLCKKQNAVSFNKASYSVLCNTPITALILYRAAKLLKLKPSVYKLGSMIRKINERRNFLRQSILQFADNICSAPEEDRHEIVKVEDKVSLTELDVSNDKKVRKVPNKKGSSKGRKRKKEEESDDADSKPAKSKKVEKETKKTAKKEKIPDVGALDFSNDSKSPDGKPWNFKISSWNINGIRAWLEKNGMSYMDHEEPDIICVQETKCSDDKLPEEVKEVKGYHVFWLSGDKEGYSGVGLLSKEKPIKVEYGIGVPEHDNEGRVITAEYDKFYLVSTYVPNAGRGLVRLDYRMKWDEDFRAYLKKLDAEKPVILCGDLNVAHEEIDLANPKTNKKNAGFTKEEREGFSALLKEGFVDTFRHLYPDMKGAYTFWTYMMNARAKNVGWRLDYFVISERFTDNLCDNVIRKEVFGSDHCPITLFLSL